MSFFTTSDNQTIKQSGGFEMGGGAFDPIPANTQLKAMIDEAKWDSYEGDSYISLRWVVIDGEFKGRKIFQKVRVKDQDPKKADKAKHMLVAIDFNAGGKLVESGVEPDDMALMINLVNKPMFIMVDVWEINDKKGNWVKAVSGSNQPVQQSAAPTTEQRQAEAAAKVEDDLTF